VREMERKQFIAAMLVVTLILTAFGLIVSGHFQGAEESVPKYLEISFPAAYFIDENTTHAFLYNGTTLEMEWSSTDHDDVFNAAFGNLTTNRDWQEWVVYKGNFTINNPIVMPSFSGLKGYGTITLEAGADCHMIINEDQVTNGNQAVSLETVTLDGYEDQQGAGPYHGIYFKNPGTPQNPDFGDEATRWPGQFCYEIIRCRVTRVQGSCLKMNASGGTMMMSRVERCVFRYGSGSNEAYAIQLINVADCDFIGPGYSVGNTYAMYMWYSNGNHFVNWYFAGSGEHGNYVEACSRNTFTNCRVDGHDKHGWFLTGYYGVSKNEWVGCYVTNTLDYLSSNNSYSGWYFDDCNEYHEQNSFTSCVVAHWGSITNGFKYGWDEHANLKTRDNVITGCVAVDPYSGFENLNANNKADPDNNIS